MQPLVSICIPTWNGEAYIEEALNSIVVQTYRQLEIIISDDASTDNTLPIIRKVTKTWDFPVYIYSHKPSGIGANWNYCVEKAKGKYVKFLFQDDLLYPDCVSELVKVAEKDEKIGLVFSKREILGNVDRRSEWFQKYYDLTRYWEKLSEIQNGRDLLRQSVFLSSPGNKVGEPSVVLLKRECFEQVGYFSVSMKQALDYEFWYRVMASYKVGFVNKSLAAFRVHPMQATKINETQCNNIDETVLYFRSLRKNIFGFLSPMNRLKLLFLELKFNWLKYREDLRW